MQDNYFDCEKLSARLSIQTCAQKYKAQKEFSVCKTCPIGAKHAGVKIVNTISRAVCARCFKSASRLIRGAVCVSCYNREREYIKGKNAKGMFPVMAKKVYPVEASYIVDGEIKKSTVMVVDRIELSITILRDNPNGMLMPITQKILSAPHE